MFDTYKPAQVKECPVCGGPLIQWQGKDGPCALFVWEEGFASPTTQEADDMNISEEERNRVRLPASFEIYSHDCDCQYTVEAICEAINGTWVSTKIINSSIAKQKKEERKEDFKKRLKWLEGTTT